MANLGKVATDLMRHLCQHDWHGYAQDARWGDGEGVCPVTVDGVTYNLQQGDRDCSSAVIECWRLALMGTPYEGVLNDATYTGNMRTVFVGSGLFEWMPMSYIAQPGDIYLNEANHTAMCLSSDPDLMGEFSINSFGGITGDTTGDQTGNESHIVPYKDFPWDGILRFKGISTSPNPKIKVQIYQANGSDAQRFRPCQNVDGSFTFRNVKFDKLLDAKDGKVENGTEVIGWHDEGGYNQRWLVIDRYIDTSFGRHVELAPVLDYSKRIDVANGNLTSGAEVILWDANLGPNQTWTIIVNDDGTWTFMTNNGLALDMYEG